MKGRDDTDQNAERPEKPETNGTKNDSAVGEPPANGSRVDTQDADEEGKPSKHTESVTAETLQRVKTTEVVMAVLTFVIAITGCIVLWVYWNQLQTMQDTLNEIKISGVDTHFLAKSAGAQAKEMATLAEQTKVLAEQTKALAGSAKTSADAAQTSANNSDRIARGSENAVRATQASTRLDQRAWLGAVTFTPEYPLVSGKPFHASVLLHNSGKTPARNVTTAISMAGFPTGDGEPKAFPPARIIGRRSKSILAPNGSYELQWTFHDKSDNEYVFTDAEVALYATKPTPPLTMYLWGHADYETMGCHHWMKFCAVYNPTNNTFEPCENGNEIDEEPCKSNESQ